MTDLAEAQLAVRAVKDAAPEIPVAACMTFDPVTVTPDTPVIQAARLMRDRKIGGLPVMDGDQLVGIVTETDMLDALIKLLGS